MLQTCIQKIATGPEYSQDLSLDEARDAMTCILSGDTDPVQTAVFLLALRMKRETEAENLGILQAIQDTTEPVSAAVDTLINIADPYDGFNRCLPMAPFLPAVLAACGVPALSQGLESITPKYGATHRVILKQAGVDVDLSPEAAAKRVAAPEIGWAYLDQRYSCPPLYALVSVRNRMIKRSVLATVERVTRPLQARQRNHLLIGYVHKAYPPFYARLAEQAGFQSATILRGVEGGVMPSLKDSASVFEYRLGEGTHSRKASANELGVQSLTRAVPIPAYLDLSHNQTKFCCVTAEMGLAALGGKPGTAFDSLLYSATLVLRAINKRNPILTHADTVRQVLTSGKALQHFRNGA